MMSLFVFCSKTLFVRFIEFFQFGELILVFFKLSKALQNEFRRAAWCPDLKYILFGRLRSYLDTFMCCFGFNPRGFLLRLHKIGGVIAGEFATAVFSGELYLSTAIVVYVPYSADESLETKMEKCGLESYFTYNRYVRRVVSDNDGCAFGSIVYYNEYSKKTIKIFSDSWTVTNGDAFGDSVVQSFEVTPVMSYIEMTHTDKIRFCTHFVVDITIKNIRINPMYPCPIHLGMMIDRLVKYARRGYILDCTIEDKIPGYSKLFNDAWNKKFLEVNKRR